MTAFPREPFLDFSFNGHDISEYGLVVVSDGERQRENLFADFQHTTETIPGRVGTLYWGTEIGGRTITKNLATGGMTSRQLAAFKQNFRPGTYAKFFNWETPYKYGYAYVQDNSTFNFVPFDNVIKAAGRTFKDTLYKGEVTLNFFFPNPTLVSDWYLDNRRQDWNQITKKWNSVSVPSATNEDWFLESGLPLTAWFGPQNPSVQVAMGMWYGTPVSSGTSIKFYHAGTAETQSNFTFQKTMPASPSLSSITSLWTNISFPNYGLTIRPPRFIQDLVKTRTLVNESFSSWATKKPQIIEILQEELDSPLKLLLIEMVLKTGAGQLYPTFASLETQLKNILGGRIIKISINGITQSSIAEGTVYNPVTNQTFFIRENILDATENRFITIPPNPGITFTQVAASLSIKTLSSNITLENWSLFFQNTYE